MSRVLRSACRPAVLAAALATVLLGAVPATAAAPDGPAGFPGTVPLPAGSQPEGIADGPGTTFFAGARADGSIYRGDLRTGEGEVLVPGSPGRVAVGMRYDERTGLLWVAGGATGTVTAYDGRTGREVGRWTVPGDVFLDDVEVTREAVYVTDSREQRRLVVIPLGRHGHLPPADGWDGLELSGDYVPAPAPAFNLNGIRALPGGDLIVTQSSTGDLFRIDPDTGATTRLQVSGPDLTSGDGLVLRGSTLYVVNGFATDAAAVVRLRRGGEGARVLGAVGDADLDRPTTGILVAGDLWLVNGRFSVPPTPTTPYDVVRVELRQDPVPPQPAP